MRAVARSTWIPRLVGLVLLLLALTGAFAWLTRLSPFPLERWEAIETQHSVVISRPGTYVLFEEGDGVATMRGEARVNVDVRSIANRSLVTRPLIDATGSSSQTYDVGIHEGRAAFAIDIDRPGRYLIVSYASGRGERDRFRNPSTMPGLALGVEGEPSSWGSLGGLAVLAGIPLLGGVVVLGAARRWWPVSLGPVLRPRGNMRG